MADKIKVAVLGATGLVGQKFIQILSNHPFFEVALVAASAKSAGKKYKEAVEWFSTKPLPEDIGELEVVEAKPENIEGVDLVFSALPSSVAGPIEVELAKKGLPVVSNASPMRLDEDVPLLNPEVNWEHAKLIEVQQRRRGWKGFIAKNPNCTTAILTLSLKPLMDAYGLDRVLVTTMQAISGAGLDGISGLRILDNIVPFIKNEEEKVMKESRKILGTLKGDHIEPAQFKITATCTRVPVIDGHLESVYAYTKKPLTSPEEIAEVLSSYKSMPQEEKLPTAPEQPIILRLEEDRPQPRLDREAGKGMAVTVGRIRRVEDNLLAYLVLGHNLVRGAAGVAVLVAETLHALGYI